MRRSQHHPPHQCLRNAADWKTDFCVTSAAHLQEHAGTNINICRHPRRIGTPLKLLSHGLTHIHIQTSALCNILPAYSSPPSPPPNSSDVYTTAHQAGKSKERSPQTQGALRLLLYQSPLMISICSPSLLALAELPLNKAFVRHSIPQVLSL